MSIKKDARHIQRYVGTSYSTALRWVKKMRASNLIQAELDNGTADRNAALRVALHKWYPDVRIARDKEA